ncbi:MAG TPA: helix-turn-helix domain-containing protein [Gammaproteobacteria bacterium]|jgi:hypothetical protein|nr:helix-turn-helix domain-containing protein [Gammaproteobacteria bacterium]
MARGRKTQLKVILNATQRALFESWQRSTTHSAGLVRRGRLLLLLSEGLSVTQVAIQVDLTRRHIYKWVYRFQSYGVAGLEDQPRSGRPPVFPPRSRTACRQVGLRAA